MMGMLLGSYSSCVPASRRRAFKLSSISQRRPLLWSRHCLMGLGCMGVTAGHVSRGINNKLDHQQFIILAVFQMRQVKTDRVSLEGYTQAWHNTGHHVARQLEDLSQDCQLRDAQKLLRERGRVCTAAAPTLRDIQKLPEGEAGYVRP